MITGHLCAQGVIGSMTQRFLVISSWHTGAIREFMHSSEVALQLGCGYKCRVATADD